MRDRSTSCRDAWVRVVLASLLVAFSLARGLRTSVWTDTLPSAHAAPDAHSLVAASMSKRAPHFARAAMSSPDIPLELPRAAMTSRRSRLLSPSIDRAPPALAAVTSDRKQPLRC